MLEKAEEAPIIPKMKINALTPAGSMKITFDQKMFVPADKSTTNYSGILDFEVQSAID